jgi:hypothetical protein
MIRQNAPVVKGSGGLFDLTAAKDPSDMAGMNHTGKALRTWKIIRYVRIGVME